MKAIAINRTLIITITFIIICLVGCKRSSVDNGFKLNGDDVEIEKIPIPYGFSKIDFINEQVGYGISYNGEICKTTDAGLNWVKVKDSNELIDIQFLDENNGFVLGGKEPFYILKTQDGGATFTRIEINEADGLEKILFINNEKGFILGFNCFFMSVNGGTTWEKKIFEDFTIFNTINFLNENIGYLAGSNYLYKTTDGGNSWNKIVSSIDSPIYEIYLLDENLYYFIGQYAYRIENDFKIIQKKDHPLYFTSTHFCTPNTAISFGYYYQEVGFYPYGSFWVTNNGCETWSKFDVAHTIKIYSVDFFSEEKAYALTFGYGSNQLYLLKINLSCIKPD
jgi:hypothetical protein